jgi:hypothetical protein
MWQCLYTVIIRDHSMNSHLNTIKPRQQHAQALDPDGSLLKEVLVHEMSARKEVDTINALAEDEFLKIHDQNKLEAEKKSYRNKQYGEEIFLSFLLEECRMYLSFIRIIEQNMDNFLEQQAVADHAKYEESIKMLQSRFQDIYQLQVKPAPLNQDKTQLYAKALSHLSDIRTKLAEVSQQLEKDWGAPTWDDGLQKRAKEAITAIRGVDPLEGIDLPPEKIDEAKVKFEKMYEILEERLANRFSFVDIRKLLDASHKSHAEMFASKSSAIIVGADAPMAPAPPTIDKIYAPKNKQIKTQYEVDTELLLAANGRHAYQSIFDGVVQAKSFTRMGVDLAKREFEALKTCYTNAIHHYTDGCQVRENLTRLESKVNHMIKEMKLELDSNDTPSPGKNKH